MIEALLKDGIAHGATLISFPIFCKKLSPGMLLGLAFPSPSGRRWPRHSSSKDGRSCEHPSAWPDEGAAATARGALRVNPHPDPTPAGEESREARLTPRKAASNAPPQSPARYAAIAVSCSGVTVFIRSDMPGLLARARVRVRKSVIVLAR